MLLFNAIYVHESRSKTTWELVNANNDFRFVHACMKQYILTFNFFRVLTIDSFTSVFIELTRNALISIVIFDIASCWRVVDSCDVTKGTCHGRFLL